MKKAMAIMVTVGSICLADASMAQHRPGYNFVYATYVREDIDEFDCTQDGLAVGGSLAVDEQIFVAAQAIDVSGDGCGSQLLRVESGIRQDYGTASSLFAKASLFNLDIDNLDSGLGFGLAAGIRSYIDSGVEAFAQITYDNVDIDNVDLGVTFGGGVVYHLQDGISLTGELTYGVENETLGTNVGVRYSF